MMKKLLTLLTALFLALGSAGLAAGQIGDDGALTGEDHEGALSEDGGLGGDHELTENLPFEDMFELGLEEPSDAQDFTLDADRIQSVDRNVDLDEDTLFNALAIANNNGEEIGFNDIADIETTETHFQNAEATSDFEEETVFAALALGVDAEDEGELETLAAGGGDVARELEVERTAVQDFDLERDNTLFAIALSNSAGSELDLHDVASVERTVSTSVDASQEVDLDTEDAFLALAIGIGGDNGGDFGDEEEQTFGEEEENGILGGEEEQTFGEEEENGILGGEEEQTFGEEEDNGDLATSAILG